MLKKHFHIIFYILSLFLSTSSLAGGGHSHDPVAPPTGEQVVARAFSDLEAIVDQSIPIEGKALDESWKMITDRKILEKSSGYYITAFTHPEEKRTLYMLMNSSGFLLNANFTGEF